MGLDVLYWACLFLGSSYLLLSVALGGVSHLAAQISGSLGGGEGADIGHAGDTGDFGHADVGHADFGHADVGHAEFGHSDFGHADVGHADVGHSDFGHSDFGHADAGNADGGADAGHAETADAGGEAHSGEHGAGHGHHDAAPGVKLLSFLSPILATGFLVGFGGTGVLARLAKMPPIPSLAWAAAGGAMLYYVAWWVIHDVFGGAQASSHTRRGDLVGHSGRVTAPIEGLRPGMICLVIAGSRQSVPAITDEGVAIPVGATVRIRRISGTTAVVARVGESEPPRVHVKGA
jgi:membrane protein implicated in regulation of membrane protease activity